jgi:hypothetical protein
MMRLRLDWNSGETIDVDHRLLFVGGVDCFSLPEALGLWFVALLRSFS